MDTITCSDKEEAKRYVDAIGQEFIDDWDFLEDGKIKLYLKEGWKDEQDNTKNRNIES